MEKKDVERINELARKSKSAGLTPEEAEEQQKLRRQYLDEFKENLRLTLDNTYVVSPNGEKRKLEKKKPLQ